MANRKFLFVNADHEIEEEVESVDTSSGSGDAGKLATLDSDGKWDVSMIPDSIINGMDRKDSVRGATTAALPASTYNNGTAGVGATLTADANGAFPAIDGVTYALSEEILVKDQAAGLQNGPYVLTQLGDGSNPWILTRREDADEDSEVTAGMTLPIAEGTANENKTAFLTTNDPITVGTTALNYTLVNTSNLTAGDGVDITGNVVSADLVADGGLEFSSGEIQVKFADTSVAADLDGTNGLHAISAEDLSSNGANQGAHIIGGDPTSIPQSSQTNVQGILEDMAAAIVAPGVEYTAGTGGVTAGDLLYVSGNDTVLPLPITGGTSSNWGVGLAATTEIASATVRSTEDDEVLTGVLTALSPTAGDKVFWDGSALTLTAPSGGGSLVWQVGVAKNVNDLHIDIERVKRNAA